jgi:hypothetical protein
LRASQADVLASSASKQPGMWVHQPLCTPSGYSATLGSEMNGQTDRLATAAGHTRTDARTSGELDQPLRQVDRLDRPGEMLVKRDMQADRRIAHRPPTLEPPSTQATAAAPT